MITPAPQGEVATKLNSRERRRLETRQALLDAAEQLFLRRGFSATSLDLIAEEAGFTKGAVYSHFANKDDLFLALLDRRARRLLYDYATNEEPQSPLDLLTSHLGLRPEYDRGWSALGYEFWSYAAHRPVLRRHVVELHWRIRESVTIALSRELGASGSGNASEAKDLANLVMALLAGLAFMWSLDESMDYRRLLYQGLARLTKAEVGTARKN